MWSWRFRVAFVCYFLPCGHGTVGQGAKTAAGVLDLLNPPLTRAALLPGFCVSPRAAQHEGPGAGSRWGGPAYRSQLRQPAERLGCRRVRWRSGVGKRVSSRFCSRSGEPAQSDARFCALSFFKQRTWENKAVKMEVRPWCFEVAGWTHAFGIDQGVIVW